ncbi:gamma-mobile-trio protein GmtX [Paraburkholderia sp. CNPSo 3272]|uniref:gamma-mobile-trio protein GmtX n=1 Tax=Paraburkholderia sp. CNPSo 3272 TaxID=2940931 RepID=UPI0020B8AE0F|nr:gamma-mobile-trio protein GmtX [Paraburkholderia sp. CNPSo 3272]MCP3728472.1 gamma-mobile-trio protein GmtX [Paraburkholderia sp. CNPSo 3272]
MTKTEPTAFLEELCRNVHPRTEASLRLICAICQEQKSRGSADYSVATIGRLSAERGGPSAPALRNKTGEKYRALVAAFAEHAGGRKKKVSAAKASAAEELLEGISDPVLRTRINLLVADLESTRAQLLAARHIAAQKAILVLGDPAQEPPSVVGNGAELTAQERRALAASISDKTMDHWAWKIDKIGRVLTDSGQVVFPAGFASAIRKILA